MITVITAVLVALKIAGVGSFSWWIPIGVFVIGNAIKIGIALLPTKNDIGSDWHDKMFD